MKRPRAQTVCFGVGAVSLIGLTILWTLSYWFMPSSNSPGGDILVVNGNIYISRYANPVSVVSWDVWRNPVPGKFLNTGLLPFYRLMTQPLENAASVPMRRLGVPFWIPMVVAAAMVRAGLYRRVPPGHCQQCRYDLTGNTSGVCPECGTAVASVPSVANAGESAGPGE